MRTAVGPYPTRYLEDFLQVVDCIYAAACGEAAWDRALAEVSRVGRLDGCALCAIDRREPRRLVLASYGLGATEGPMLGPMPPGPPSDRILRSFPGTVWQDCQMVSERPARAPCKERMQANASAPRAGVVVGRDDRQVVSLEAYAGIGRPSGGPELDDFLRQLAPHLTRAWRLGGRSRLLPAALAAASRTCSQCQTAPAPDRGRPADMARLRAEFGLTKAEARLALRLADGASLAGAAEAFDVKLTTIRSQLQQVFAKTGTSRQAELVALLLSHSYGPPGPLWSSTNRRRQPAGFAGAGS
jgi:DNA-binding CsgD family transcriptional regulator